MREKRAPGTPVELSVSVPPAGCEGGGAGGGDGGGSGGTEGCGPGGSGGLGRAGGGMGGGGGGETTQPLQRAPGLHPLGFADGQAPTT